MAKVYISCHHADPANELAAHLLDAGHEVVSTWHTDAITDAAPRPALDDAIGWAAKADANFALIFQADVLALIAGPDRYTGGKFIEAGYALGRWKRVIVVGRVENGMLHHPKVEAVPDAGELIARLQWN